MSKAGQDSGIVKIAAEKFAELAVHVLQRLDYQIVSASTKTFGRILAKQDKSEQIGRDWWNYKWRIELEYEPLDDDNGDYEGILLEIVVREETGTGTSNDCSKRADNLIRLIKKDAQRMEKVSEWQVKPTTHGSASWASFEELEAQGYITEEVDPARTLLTKVDGKFISVPERETYKHALVCGRTGVGKSSGFFIPNLIERLGACMLVTEAVSEAGERGELYTLTSGWRQMSGHKIYSFNPSDLTSTRINPLDSVRQAPQNKKTEVIKKLVELVASSHGDFGANEKSWVLSEKQLLFPLILHASTLSEGKANFATIVDLLENGVDQIADQIKNSKAKLAVRSFNSWYNNATDNFRRLVAAGLMSKLGPWQTDQIRELTSVTDIEPDVLQNDLFTIYMSVPVTDKESKILTALVFNYVLSMLLKHRPKMNRPLTLLLDEFTNFGAIPGIENTLSLVRKNKVSLTLGFQNYKQVEIVYGQQIAGVIIDQPGTQVYFRQKNFREAKLLSDALGRTTVEERKVTDTGKVNEHIYGRNLMTPDELITLPKEEVIVFTPDTGPIKVEKFKPGIYDQATSYPPPERPEHDISEAVKSRHEEEPVPPEEVTEDPIEQDPADEILNEVMEKKLPGKSDKEKDKDKTREVEEEKEPDLADQKFEETPTGDDTWQL